MKKIVLIAGMFISLPVISQTVDTSTVISVISANRDTLYLAQTHMGHMVYKSWDHTPETEKPVIIFKKHSWIIEEKSKQR
jgi:5,10-methylene-tetrahydrofolate dehydrogenase/methenyl tetrahydrofolate cyclohydrolase